MNSYTEYGLDQSLMTNTDSPRLAVTPGEWYASEMIRMIRTELRQMNGFTRIIGARCDCWTVGVVPSLIPPRLIVCGAVGLDDLGWTGKDGSPSPSLGTIIKISYDGSSVLSTSLGSKTLNNTSTPVE